MVSFRPSPPSGDPFDVPDLPVAEAVDRLLEAARTGLGADIALITELSGTTQILTHLNGDAALYGWTPGDTFPAGAGVGEGNGAGVHGTIGACVEVPLPVGGNRIYGSLWAVSERTRPDFDASDVDVLRFLSGLIGRELARAERETQQERLLATIAGYLRPGALRMHAQRVVDLDDGRTIGLEALARFPGAEETNPADMFAAADSVGLGQQLEMVAIRAALTAVSFLPEGTFLSINASPALLAGDELSASLTDDVCRRVVVELTEHVAFAEHPELIERVERLRARGVRIAMDDTGAGYAGLQTILALRPDIIKLDLALVSGVDSDLSRRSLIRALAEFAADTGAQLLAEGIETAGELEALREIGVTRGQGFHLGRPVPFDTMEPVDTVRPTDTVEPVESR